MTTGKKFVLVLFITALTAASVFFNTWSSAATLNTCRAEVTEHTWTEEADANFKEAMADLEQLYDEVLAQEVLQ